MKKRKKSFVLILCLIICLLAIGACGTAQETAEQTSSEVLTTEESTEETTPAPTEPPTLDPSEVKVGMIFYGEEDDGSVLAAALKSGLEKAAAGLGIGKDQILWQYNSREADWTQIEDSILSCVDAGCQIVFGGAREYRDVIAAVAEEYPDIMFACVGSSLVNGTNSGTYEISLAAVQYLCGVAAGSASTSDHVGFLAAKDTSDEEVTAAVNAFAYGVWSVNPEAVVEAGITGKWFLPEAETQGVSELQGLGCDTIGGYTDGSAGLAAAASVGLRVTGCGVSDSGIYGEAYDTQAVGAALYNFEEYFSMKLNQVINRQVTGEAWIGDFYSGAAVFQSPGVIEAMEDAWEQLRAWGPVEEETGAEESGEEESGPESDTDTETGGNPEAEAESESEVESEPEEIPLIAIDKETGYLENVRIHIIEVKAADES